MEFSEPPCVYTISPAQIKAGSAGETATVQFGASRRNWEGYGAQVRLAGLSVDDQALLTDPQTSGGLLVSCAPDALGAVMDCFTRHGFLSAAVIGGVKAAGDAPLLTVSA